MRFTVGRADLHQSAQKLAEVLAKDKKQWMAEDASGATKPHRYDETLTVTCVRHQLTLPSGHTAYKLEVLGGLPNGMPDPGVGGPTPERAEWRLRWAIAAFCMDRKRRMMRTDQARAFAKRAEIYTVDKEQHELPA